jgi:small-conductance mechanosensitive channel
LILRFWIADPQNGVTNIKGAALLAVWDAYKAAGIELALPTREIVLKKPVGIRLEREDQRIGTQEKPPA